MQIQLHGHLGKFYIFLLCNSNVINYVQIFFVVPILLSAILGITNPRHGNYIVTISMNLQWDLIYFSRSSCVPLLTSISIDQTTGVLTPVCPRHAAIKLSEVIKPMKVIFLNDCGGLVDDCGKVWLFLYHRWWPTLHGPFLLHI